MEVDLNVLQKMSTEYAEAKKQAIQGKFLSCFFFCLFPRWQLQNVWTDDMQMHAIC